jgi:hypothetical protein
MHEATKHLRALASRIVDEALERVPLRTALLAGSAGRGGTGRMRPRNREKASAPSFSRMVRRHRRGTTVEEFGAALECRDALPVLLQC